MADKNSGLITSLVVGVGMMIVAVLILFVVLATIGDADLLGTQAGQWTTYNETGPAGTVENMQAWLNTTPYNLGNASYLYRDYAIVTIYNASSGGDPIVIPSTNYTLTETETGAYLKSKQSGSYLTNYSSVNITYTMYKKTSSELAYVGMRGNFTGGIQNVNTKLPTILLISAVVLLFGVLVILVFRARSMMGVMGRAGSTSGKTVDSTGYAGSL